MQEYNSHHPCEGVTLWRSKTHGVDGDHCQGRIDIDDIFAGSWDIGAEREGDQGFAATIQCRVPNHEPIKHVSEIENFRNSVRELRGADDAWHQRDKTKAAMKKLSPWQTVRDDLVILGKWPAITPIELLKFAPPVPDWFDGVPGEIIPHPTKPEWSDEQEELWKGWGDYVEDEAIEPSLMEEFKIYKAALKKYDRDVAAADFKERMQREVDWRYAYAEAMLAGPTKPKPPEPSEPTQPIEEDTYRV